MKKYISKLVLINAPINKRYQDSTSLFCPPLGLLSIKAFVEQKNPYVEIVLLDGMILSQEEIIARTVKEKPDMVGISIQLLSYLNAIEICKITKQLGAINFVGGHHASKCFRPILKNKHKIIDFVIYGDGEIPISMLCEQRDFTQIPNLVYWDSYNNKVVKNETITPNLKEYVNPYRAKSINFAPYQKNLKDSNFSYHTGRYLRIYSHKGCNYRAQGKRCTFCGRADEGYRFDSIENYFEILKSLNLTDNDYIFDVGDDLLGNREWLNLAVKYKERNSIYLSPIGIFGRADEINTETVEKIKELGVVDVTVGVESGSNLVIKNSGKSINDTDIFISSSITLFENGISITPSYVLGMQGENERTIYQTIKHAERIKELSSSILGKPPGEIVANLLEPIPGSYNFKLLCAVFPEKYMDEDELELETMQKDYFSLVHNLTDTEYEKFRKLMSDAGSIINSLAPFSDSQGWLANELNIK